MKSKLFFCLSAIIFFAQACSSSVSIPTTALATPTLVTPTAPAPTAPAVAEAPATPTETPTATPTVEPTATESIDPETGWKMQIVDGEKQLFSPDVNAWVVPSGSAYLIRHDEWSPVSDAFQMQVFYLAENGFVVPAISQAPRLPSARFNFTTIFLPKVEKRMLGHMVTDPKDDVSMLQSGKPITISNGESFTITTDSKYRVYIMPWEKMSADSQEIITGYRWIAGGDGKNAYGIISMQNTPTSKQDFIYRLMYPLAAMMSPNQSAGLYSPKIGAYAAGDGDYANSGSLTSFGVSGLP